MKGRVAFAAIAVMCAGVAFAEAVVKASSFGFDPEDATEILQKALDSGARKIVIDKQASPWITRPLFARSNCEIVFEGGVEVVAKKGAFLGKGDSLLTLDRVENVKVSASGGGTVAHHVQTSERLYVRGILCSSARCRPRLLPHAGEVLVTPGSVGMSLVPDLALTSISRFGIIAAR